jgi:hypothetical protein
MKKIGMVVAAAAVVSYAGAARAQTTEQIVEAVANIDAVMTLEGDDLEFDCGTVSGFGTISADCTGEAHASVIVTANQNWSLSVEDIVDLDSECANQGSSSAGADKVSLCNDDAASDGAFVVSLDYTAACSEADIDADFETIVGTSAEDCTVDIGSDNVSPSIAGLGTEDGFGLYEGQFRVTLNPAL